MAVQNIKVSIVIPVFNEEKSLVNVIEGLKKQLQMLNIEYEIIAIDDGSTDKSGRILKNIKNIRLIKHPYNKGYGAAIKTGVKNAQYDWVMLYDSDDQHRPEYIEKLIKYQKDYDMIIGARTGYQGPLLRQPGKKLLRLLAEYLMEHKIPDLNSGFRLVKKSAFEKFAHFLPNGFSLSTTITLAFFKEGLNVKYVPITIQKRIGKSSLKTQDGFKALTLILRTIILFSPLRIFLPVSGLVFGLAIIALGLDIRLSFYQGKINIGEITVLFLISSLFFLFFGLLADQISAIRREKK